MQSVGLSPGGGRAGGLKLLLNRRRVLFTLAGSVHFALVLWPGWKPGLWPLLSRTLLLGFIAMLAFGLFEQWPKRLPRWMARWVLDASSVYVPQGEIGELLDIPHFARSPGSGFSFPRRTTRGAIRRAGCGSRSRRSRGRGCWGGTPSFDRIVRSGVVPGDNFP